MPNNIMSDLFTAPLNLIRSIFGETSSGGALRARLCEAGREGRKYRTHLVKWDRLVYDTIHVALLLTHSLVILVKTGEGGESESGIRSLLANVQLQKVASSVVYPLDCD